MKIPYVLLDFSGEVERMDSQWDMTLIKDIIDGKVWRSAQGYKFRDANVATLKLTGKEIPGFEGAIVVIPGRQNSGHELEVTKFIEQLEWAVVIITGDEERQFDYKKLEHPNMKIWLMHPLLDDEADYYIGSGYTPNTRKMLTENKDGYVEKPLDWFFAGQNNHGRREQAVEVLDKMKEREDISGEIIATGGFTKGLQPAHYYELLSEAKAAPAPSGIQSPDSFRLYEALEAGAVPIADDLSSVLVQEPGYWDKVFNGHGTPFKVLTDYANLEGYIMDVVREYPAYNNRVFAWWQNVKRGMSYKLDEHVHELSGLPYNQDTILSKITVIIPTSPIPSHPDTRIIDQTISDLRKVLPDCEIIIGIDGIRKEQEDRRSDYEDYKKELLWKCNYEWSNVLPVAFEEHLHQAAMTKKLLELVKTPTILFVEHDTALVTEFNGEDTEYDWSKFIGAIESGQANVIRFHHEASILPDHKHLMLGESENIGGVELTKTMQWSQRPHLASTAFYKDMLNRYFTDESRTMIEDVVHSPLQTDSMDEGLMGWYKWRVWVYTPPIENIKRSYTTDGRENDLKFEMRF